MRINTVEPRSAVLSEGAEVCGSGAHPDQIESHGGDGRGSRRPVRLPTGADGVSHVSLDLIAELGIEVYDLDGHPMDGAAPAKTER